MEDKRGLKRPLGLTIVAWLLILLNLTLLIALQIVFPHQGTTFFIIEKSDSLDWSRLIECVSGIICLIAAIGILRRQNWARFLYIAFFVFSFGLHYIVAQDFHLSLWMMIPSLLFQLVVIYFMINEKANLYFTNKSTLL